MTPIAREFIQPNAVLPPFLFLILFLYRAEKLPNAEQ